MAEQRFIVSAPPFWGASARGSYETDRIIQVVGDVFVTRWTQVDSDGDYIGSIHRDGQVYDGLYIRASCLTPQGAEPVARAADPVVAALDVTIQAIEERVRQDEATLVTLRALRS